MHQEKKKNHSISLPRVGRHVSRAYQMDYDVFMSLHELLKPGIDEYVNKSNNSNNKECFYRHNGAIRSLEICLAAALWYFAGGSYLDITISHGIGKTERSGLWYMQPTIVPNYSFGSQPHYDRIPSTNPGAEPPRDARDSGSARPHSIHLETSFSDRP